VTQANLLAAKAVADTLRTSLGPKGMDKMMVSPDGEVLVSNDGATIVTKMEIVHPIAQLLVELSKSQDDEIGDGTTGVVVLAGALIKQALLLLDKGIHPLSIASGFEKACDMACTRLDQICREIDIEANDHEYLVKAATISLGSKIVSKCQDKMARIAKDAVLAIADLKRRDVNFDMIKIVPKVGGSLEDTQLLHGLLIDKDFSHPQMEKEVTDAKIVILTCPFEPPKLKNKNSINITNAQDYKALAQQEQDYFENMVKIVKDSGANVAMCQWGFDDEANHLLLQHGLQAVRWVSGTDIELLAMATGARIVPRFEEIEASKLGTSKSIQEMQFGTSNQKMLLIDCKEGSKVVSIIIRGSSRMVVDETNRSLHDAMCVVRNLIKDSRVVLGGGATEINLAINLRKEADSVTSFNLDFICRTVRSKSFRRCS
jgi:T-complex protein 1 subunit epsilon